MLAPHPPCFHHFAFRASSVIGLCPFRSVEGRPKLDLYLALYSTFLAASVSLLGILSFQSILDVRLGAYTQAALNAYFAFYVFSYPLNLLVMIRERNRLRGALLSIDSARIALGSSRKRKRSELASLFVILLIVCGNISYNLNFRVILVEVIFLIFADSAMFLVFGQFSHLVDSVGDVLLRSKEALSEAEVKRDTIMMVRVVASVSKLFVTSGSINKIYSTQILVYFTLSFIGYFIHAYFALLLYNAGSYGKVCSHIYSIFFSLNNVWKVTRSSMYAYKKSKEFNNLLYQLMIDDRTNEVLNNEKLRLHISMRREVTFTACGFFNLDYTLVHSMIASATTYLVILVQFGQPEMIKASSVGNLTVAVSSMPNSTSA